MLDYEHRYYELAWELEHPIEDKKGKWRWWDWLLLFQTEGVWLVLWWLFLRRKPV